jgi:hypothetical protein
LNLTVSPSIVLGWVVLGGDMTLKPKTKESP